MTTEYKTDDNKNNIKSTDKLSGLITRKLYDLKKQTNIYYVVGNHDYSILYFSTKVDKFPLSISKNLHLKVKESNKKFYFIHGYKFEVLANLAFISIEEYESICKHLCEVRETTIGKIESTVWSSLHFQFANQRFGEHLNVVESITKLPENRMKEEHQFDKSQVNEINPLLYPRNKIEELAMSPVARSMFIGGEPNETIIFGHTHSPFITKDKMIVNSGSWVKDNNLHNTYVKIYDNGDLDLIRYQ